MQAGVTQQAKGALSDTKITRIRVWNPTGTNGLSDWINLSEIMVTIETDAGIIDGFVNAVGYLARGFGWFGSLFQTGALNTYAFILSLGVLIILGSVIF